MQLKARLLDVHAGGQNIAILDDDTSSFLGVRSSDRVKITCKGKSAIAIVNLATDFPIDYVGLYEETAKKLGAADGERVEVQPASVPEALHYVQAKIRGERLREHEIGSIAKDVVERHLSDVEIAAFITALG